MKRLAFLGVLFSLGAGGRYDPVITSATLTRSVVSPRSNYWHYRLNVTGRRFDTRAVVLIDGEVAPGLTRQYAGRDPYKLRVDLGVWCPFYREMAEHEVAVRNGLGGESEPVKVKW